MTSVTPRQTSNTARSATAPTDASSDLAIMRPRVVEQPDAGRLGACYRGLDRIRLPGGLYLASPSADYSKAWIRDNVYEVLPYVDKATPHYEETYWRLLDIHRYHEWKIDAIIREKPANSEAYIHARFHPDTITEFDEPWGNKQNDATGAFLWGLAEGLRHGRAVIRDERDRRVVQKIIQMLGALRYWEDPDNGIWEEYEELHASSIGACVAGLRAIRREGWDVPESLIQHGQEALRKLLPRESESKRTDLALLTLIYPYRVVNAETRRRIVNDVEKHLLRERGVIRYQGDSYYSPLSYEHGRDQPWEFYHGTEAEWTFGLPWLSLAHREMGNHEKADAYLERTFGVELEPGNLPELYYAGTSKPNPNTPLGWSIAMEILAIEARDRAHGTRR